MFPGLPPETKEEKTARIEKSALLLRKTKKQSEYSFQKPIPRPLPGPSPLRTEVKKAGRRTRKHRRRG
jgi:hypothetical protein